MLYSIFHKAGRYLNLIFLVVVVLFLFCCYCDDSDDDVVDFGFGR